MVKIFVFASLSHAYTFHLIFCLLFFWLLFAYPSVLWCAIPSLHFFLLLSCLLLHSSARFFRQLFHSSAGFYVCYFFHLDYLVFLHSSAGFYVCYFFHLLGYLYSFICGVLLSVVSFICWVRGYFFHLLGFMPATYFIRWVL